MNLEGMAEVAYARPAVPAARPTLNHLHHDPAEATCASCNVRGSCLPRGLSQEDVAALFDATYTQRRVNAGHALYRAGAAFDAIYAVRTGFLKSSFGMEDDSRDRVTGFHMAGEIVGMEALGTGLHASDVSALQDSVVCVIPYSRLEEPGIQGQLRKAMALELVRDQGVMLLLGTMKADERLAAFLLNLSQRLRARGFESSDFHLPMSRADIASYLGLQIETVSRAFSRFHSEGFVRVRQKHIRINDLAALRAVMAKVTA